MLEKVNLNKEKRNERCIVISALECNIVMDCKNLHHPYVFENMKLAM